MIEFDRKKLKFKLDGKEHEVNFPTVGQLKAYQKANQESQDTFETTVDFLEKLGLEKEVCMGLEADHLKTIVEYISGQKKI